MKQVCLLVVFMVLVQCQHPCESHLLPNMRFVAPIKGGLSNFACFVELQAVGSERAAVMRINGHPSYPQVHSLNRQLERELLESAPWIELIHYDDEKVVTGLVGDGQSLSRLPAMATVVYLLRQLHSTPLGPVGKAAPSFSPLSRIESRIPFVNNETSAEAISLYEKVKSLVPALEDSRVYLQCDFHPGNLVSDRRRLVLLDYEYVAVGHPVYDLVTVSVFNDLTVEQEKEMLHMYGLRDFSFSQFTRLKGFRELEEAFWAFFTAELGIADLSSAQWASDGSFRQYAEKYVRRAASRFEV